MKVFETYMPVDTLTAWGIGVSASEKIACYFFGTSEEETDGRCLATRLSEEQVEKLAVEIWSLTKDRGAETPLFDMLAEDFRQARTEK